MDYRVKPESLRLKQDHLRGTSGAREAGQATEVFTRVGDLRAG